MSCPLLSRLIEVICQEVGTALQNSAFAAYPVAATSDVSFVGGDASYTGGRKQMIKDVVAPFQSVI